MELVINFKADGTIESLYTDSFNLSFLGKQHIERATDIRFNDSSQLWEIWSIKYFNYGPLTEGITTYELARAIEVSWLNRCRLLGVVPESPKGIEILKGRQQTLTLQG